jgi:hypothetical protein
MSAREQELLRRLIREHAQVNEDLSDVWSSVKSGVGKAFDWAQGTDLGVQLGLADPSKNVILRKLEDLAPDTPQPPREPQVSSGGTPLAKIGSTDFGDFDPYVFADIQPSDLGDFYVRQFGVLSARREYDGIIMRAADEYDVPFEMLRAVIGAESAFNPGAKSPAAAGGIMQFIESTAAAYGLTPDERFEPEKAIPAGARLLRDLRNQFGNWPEALAAYNAGPGNVTSGRWLRIPETRNYVPTVMAYYHAEGGKGVT